MQRITADFNRRVTDGVVKVSLRRFRATPQDGDQFVFVDGEEEAEGTVLSVEHAERVALVQVQWETLQVVDYTADSHSTDDSMDNTAVGAAATGVAGTLSTTQYTNSKADKSAGEVTTDAPETDAPSPDEHDASTDDTKEKKPWGTGKKVGVFIGALVLTVGLAAGSAWLLEGPVKEWQAGGDLEQVFENRSEMVFQSSSVHDNPDATASGEQKRLGLDGEPLESAQFVFGSDSDESTQQLDLTVAFGEQRSMDFLRMNSGSLHNLVVNNVTTVHIHTAPSSGNPYSILAPEALALAVEQNPDADMWYTMMNLVKLSVEIADEGETDADVIAEKLSETLQHDGFDVTAADIQAGSFAEWIHGASAGIADDSYGLPIIELEDERINPENVEVMNPEAFSDHIWSKALQD